MCSISQGLVAESERLTSFVRPDCPMPFGLGHVEGVGRFCTFLLPVACVWHQT